MANPDNSHHVHSDGYTSERGEPDESRLMEEVADEIEQEPCVLSVYPDEDFDGYYVEVETDGSEDAISTVKEAATDYGCGIVDVNDEWVEIRPA